MLPASSRLLPSRTGSSPLRKYVAPSSPLDSTSKVSDPPNSTDRSSYLKKYSSSTPDLTYNFKRAFHDQHKPGFTSAPPLTSSDSNHKLLPKGGPRLTLPGTFISPADQHRLGLDWVRSNHNIKFNPPMPRVFPSLSTKDCKKYRKE